MANLIVCQGDVTEAVISGRSAPGVPQCSNGWVVMTQEELLGQASQSSVLSREDFNTLSAWILTILIAAMGLRIVLKTLDIGGKSNEKN